MSKRDDLLFCKIAITSGMVSEAQARKVLAICDKKEREEGRRPLIGAVFAKYNLISSPHVKKVYEAVNKRTGGQAGVTTRVKTPTAGRSRRAGGGGRRGRRAKRTGQGVDPSTLWTGIGSGVVFIAIIFVVIYLFNKAGTDDGLGVASGNGPSPASASPSTPAPKPITPTRTQPAPLPSEVVQEVRSAIMDARRDVGEDPERGLRIVRDLRTQLTGKYAPYDAQSFLEEIDALEKQLEEVAAEGSSPDTLDGGDTSDAGEVDEADAGGDTLVGETGAEASEEDAAESEESEDEGDDLDFLDDI